MTESKELLAAQAEPLTELPLEGFYGGKPKRFTIEYDDLSSRCIGNADGSVDNIVRNLLAHSTTDPRIAELEEQLRRYEEALKKALVAIGDNGIAKRVEDGDDYSAEDIAYLHGVDVEKQLEDAFYALQQALASSKEPTTNQHEANQ